MNNDELLAQALKSSDPAALKLALRLASHPLTRFRPRPDQPHLLDEQTSFYQDRFNGLACVLAGNGAGKSYVSSAKVAAFLAETPPPEPNTPFWVLSKTLDMATGCCWVQNLRHFIPDDQIGRVVWHRQAEGKPLAVALKPHANGNNYVVRFLSYDMDRQALQAANIVGFWADEQCPLPILAELWARTRKWSYPGSKVYTLTPLEPDPDLEQIFYERDKYPSWKFYRFNTRLNDTLDPNYVRQITENEAEALIETRLTGAFARYEGAVYPNFDTHLHVIEPLPELPASWTHVRGLDLGFSHATACVWAVKDLEGRYYVYKEYLKTKTSIEDHVREINDGWGQIRLKGFTFADPAAAQTLHEFALRGLPTVAANKDVKAGIACVQSLLRPDDGGRPRLFIYRSCENLIREMRSYVWDQGKLDSPRKVNDDLVDSLRYMIFSDRMQAATPDLKLNLPPRENRIKF